MKLPQRPKRGRPKKDRRRFINIAATIDYRGVNDDKLYFLFRNTPLVLLRSVFDFLIANGGGVASRAVITEEHDIVKRIGKGYWRKAVELINPDFDFCGLDSLKLLIESRLQNTYPCKVIWMPIDKFLNV